ncbi:general stress protein [Bacillus sp. AFS031507]|uniref:general stress protein n=1 Tax=Bacillus sp. AFS031507 TaxID=2033496 RepID=UPI000BFC36D6|nr:general stress protein [Bacillus sp. AFS031507]PGY12548.1 general stress protein [Bacillus sp. AFS031507]
MKQVKIVENEVQAKKSVVQFLNQGFTKEEVYILAHDKDRSMDLTDATDTNGMEVYDQGVFESLANVFRSRGDELRSNMESLGLSYFEAQQFEGELDMGRLVIVATKKVS